jgi:hypothetical protein
MLAWKREIVMDTSRPENRFVMMESCNCGFDRVKACLNEIGASNEIAKVQEGTQAFHHL